MKRGKYKIYLFRHGKTTFNRDGRFTGQMEARLTDEGRRHAKKIARELKDKTFEVAFHTHLSRSKDTLKPVLKFHPECKIILEDDRMIERSYGDLEGTTHKQFIDRIGEQGYDLRVHGDAIENLEPKLRDKVEEFLGEEEYKAIHRGYKVAAPGGESFRDVEKRVKLAEVREKNDSETLKQIEKERAELDIKKIALNKQGSLIKEKELNFDKKKADLQSLISGNAIKDMLK